MKEGLPVGNEVLKIANLWVIDRRIIHFGDDPVPKREPNPAGRGVGGSDSVFATMSPFRLDAGPAEGRAGFLRLAIVFMLGIVLAVLASSAGVGRFFRTS